ncbi:MAG: adenylate/guanylate cyclase domain-containing protein [Spirochaetales bacterium]|nr:adenylate/guanylate cyclase domain-containing protein [Spirochaetales bacterium]
MSIQKLEGLIYFTDLGGFGRKTKNMPLEEVGQLLLDYAREVERAVTEAGGFLSTMINDSALGWFPPEAADAGVRCMMDLKQDVEAMMSARDRSMSLKIGVHYGEFLLIHLPPDDQPNLIGSTVNTAFTLGAGGNDNHRDKLILSEQAFRKLNADTRKAFHKFTEPVVYLAESD